MRKQKMVIIKYQEMIAGNILSSDEALKSSSKKINLNCV